MLSQFPQDFTSETHQGAYPTLGPMLALRGYEQSFCILGTCHICSNALSPAFLETPLHIAARGTAGKKQLETSNLWEAKPPFNCICDHYPASPSWAQLCPAPPPPAITSPHGNQGGTCQVRSGHSSIHTSQLPWPSGESPSMNSPLGLSGPTGSKGLKVSQIPSSRLASKRHLKKNSQSESCE